MRHPQQQKGAKAQAGSAQDAGNLCDHRKPAKRKEAGGKAKPQRLPACQQTARWLPPASPSSRQESTPPSRVEERMSDNALKRMTKPHICPSADTAWLTDRTKGLAHRHEIRCPLGGEGVAEHPPLLTALPHPQHRAEQNGNKELDKVQKDAGLRAAKHPAAHRRDDKGGPRAAAEREHLLCGRASRRPCSSRPAIDLAPIG